ncbi:FAD-binding oxidoreductase [Patescibacteria group bacterium]|nr:FAD-binding oxidoreductase [Patescibacteria group bacterium]
MNKVAQYLQEHVAGEVMTGTDARDYFSTDNSIFNLIPSVIVYPKTENDIRKVARFSWQLAERGRIIPITARGNGTDLTGAAIGNGVLLVYPAHLNQVQYFDPKSAEVTVEAGINFGKLQQLLVSYDCFIPPAPTSLEYSTVGGAVANNASSRYSFKYGDMRKYVKGLRVILANGEVIETERLNKRELNRKLGLATFEGEIYRALDALLEENHEIIDRTRLNVSKNTAGYDLYDIKERDGSFDLTPLIVGSQGTLGLISEVTLATEPYSNHTTLVTAYIDNVNDLQAVVTELAESEERPSAMELVDDNLLQLVSEENPNYLREVIATPFPKLVLLVEFNIANEHKQHKGVKRAAKILGKYTEAVFIEEDPAKQKLIWKLRDAAALYSSHNQNRINPLPLIDDGVVPIDKLANFLTAIYDQFSREHLPVAVWGHIGDANLHIQPQLNLGQVGDRQKAFRMLEEYTETVKNLGGSTTGRYNEGRLRGPYLPKLFPDDVLQLFIKTKQIFDPHGILNPGVKINVSVDDIKPMLRHEYSLRHVYDHLPMT